MALASVLAIAGCSTGAPTATVPGSGSSPAPTTTASTPTDAPPTVAPPTAAAAIVLEDAGLETPLAAGTYTSRLFTPTVTMELGDGWFRRDDITEGAFNLRRGNDGGEVISFRSRFDFVQCGDGDVVEQPDSATFAEMVASSAKLNASEPTEIQVGDRTATLIELTGGKALPEDGWERYLDFGCVITVGSDPYPGGDGWTPITRDMVTLLVFVDVDGTPVLIRTGMDDSTSDVDALWALMTEVINSVQLG